MEIRTKFNIGDKVIYIDKFTENNETKWRVMDCFGKCEIYGFRVFADSVYCILFEENYRNKFNFDTDYNHKEEDCFLTKEEAQKECERRNGNKGTED